MSCNNHSYESDIATLDQENRQMRARMERLEAENLELQKQVDALLLVAEVKERKRLEVIQDVWKHTMEKQG
jgi:cell division protein FtsB